jgi:hypothetical protein
MACLWLFVNRAANIGEVSVRLKVENRVRVPRPQRRPKQLPASLGTDQVMTVLTSSVNCGEGGFYLPYRGGNGPTDAAGRVVLKRSMKAASSAGKWSGWLVGPLASVGHSV